MKAPSRDKEKTNSRLINNKIERLTYTLVDNSHQKIAKDSSDSGSMEPSVRSKVAA